MKQITGKDMYETDYRVCDNRNWQMIKHETDSRGNA